MKINLQNKTKTIFIVSIDDEIWGILPGRILRFFSIFPGQENHLPEENKAKLIGEIEKFNWEKLLNFLAYRERSVWECKNFLEQQFLATSLIEKLVNKARELRFVDDDRFARMYVRDLIAKSKNQKQIRSKLFEKHVPEKIVDSAISQNFSLQNKQQILKDNFTKAFRRFSDLPADTKKDKILNYLTRKGFSYGEVKELMEKEEFWKKN